MIKLKKLILATAYAAILKLNKKKKILKAIFYKLSHLIPILNFQIYG